MRILISAPRKSGSPRLRCLLASAYRLETLGPRDAPPEADAGQVAAWLTGFPEESVASVDYAWSAPLAEAAGISGVSLIAIMRHPFDLFVSNYDIAQQRAARNKDKPGDDSPWSSLAGRPLDGPDILAYARNGFSSEVAWLRGWRQSGASIVRFEQLEVDPVGAMTQLQDHLDPLERATIARSVEMCPPESFIISRPFRGRRMGNLSAGSWSDRLPDGLKAALRERFAEDVRDLGYDVG